MEIGSRTREIRTNDCLPFFPVIVTFASQLNHCSGGFIHPQRHSGLGVYHVLVTMDVFLRLLRVDYRETYLSDTP